MKNIYKSFAIAACAATIGLTGCIEETTPTSGVTAEQLAASAKAAEAYVWAMPSILNKLGTYDSSTAYDWGYGSIMHIRDVMTADQAVESSGYNWYDSWSGNTYLGPRYVSGYFTWAYYYRAIQTTNLAIKGLKGTEEELLKGYLGASYAYRALFYLDVARTYEFLPNDIYDKGLNSEGNYVMYLTCPIVTEETPEDQLQNNPRATHEEMVAFIESDLKLAEKLIPFNTTSAKTLPHLNCVYGLKARLYMWNASYMAEAIDKEGNRKYTDEQVVAEYEKAYEAADAAISLGQNSPLSASEWTDARSGFNSAKVSSWMWCSTTTAEDDVVKSGILNWTSWMSNETSYGYASAGPFVKISSELYNKMADTDFRKLSFKAPKKTALSGKEPIIVTDKTSKLYCYADLPEYSSFKFRPGGGAVDDYKTGSSVDYPLMRIEEMYLVRAEAAAWCKDVQTGVDLLETFVNTYRDPNYICGKANLESVVDAIFQQKRIEFWGEGLSFFDYKRLNKSVDRTKSTNFADAEIFKTEGRPAWMNFCITINEENNNKALKNYNNPDPSGAYKVAK